MTQRDLTDFRLHAGIDYPRKLPEMSDWVSTEERCYEYLMRIRLRERRAKSGRR
jgi:hypothetical protein